MLHSVMLSEYGSSRSDLDCPRWRECLHLELPTYWMIASMERPTQMFLVQLDDTLLCTILAALWGMFQIMDGFCPLGILIFETALNFSLFFSRDTHWVIMGKIILSRALST